MQTYQTLSGTGKFLLEIQKEEWKGEVHSTFHRTINVICQTGELYTIAAAELDNAPNTLRVVNLFSEGIAIPLHTPVIAQNGKLVIGEFAAIDIDSAKRWYYPKPIFPKKEAYQNVEKRVAQMNKWLSQMENTGGYLLNKSQATTYEKMIHSMLLKESNQLLAYLQEKQLFQAMKQLNRVVGLGPGLTPSGDDFLVGLALVFTTIDYPYHSLKQWLTNNRSLLQRKTNIISFSALDWAIKGAGRERIGSFLNELFYGENEARLKEKMKAVFSIGSTSGADMLAGMLAGIKLTVDLQRRS